MFNALASVTSNKFLLICVVFMEGLRYFLVLIIINVYCQFVCQSVLSVCLFSSPIRAFGRLKFRNYKTFHYSTNHFRVRNFLNFNRPLSFVVLVRGFPMTYDRLLVCLFVCLSCSVISSRLVCFVSFLK